MIQQFRHIVHLVISFFSDYFYLLGRPLFYQIQYQHLKNEIPRINQTKKLCLLGNGPSFSQITTHLDALNQYDFCTVNLSINNPVYKQIKPKIHVFVDKGIWVSKDREDVKLLWDNIKLIDWNISLLVPYACPKWVIDSFEKNPFVKVYRFCNNSWNPEQRFAKSLRMWLFKKGLVSPNETNVTISAIYSSILMGYKYIYLLGVEHSWMRDVRVNKKNEVVLTDRHFYGEKEMVWRNYEGNPIKLVDLLQSLHATFGAHLDLRSFADYLGDVKIINCTEGSYIDAYERGKLEDIINGETYVE